MIIEVDDSCVHSQYVYKVPVIHPLSVDRYRTEEQRLSDEYMDALLPANFKRFRPVEQPTKQFIKIGWCKHPDINRHVFWLVPTEFTAATEIRKILDVTVTDRGNEQKILRMMLNDALRGKG